MERIGGDKPVAVDVRVLVATHRDLAELVRAGKISPGSCTTASWFFPSRCRRSAQRKEDIPLLVEHFARRCARRMDGSRSHLRRTRLQRCRTMRWPGNIRELRNMVERLLLLAGVTVEEATVEMALPHRPTGGAKFDLDSGGSGALAQRVAEFEKATLLAELERSGGHVTNAAKALGLERSHFYKKCQQLGIDLKAERA